MYSITGFIIIDNSQRLSCLMLRKHFLLVTPLKTIIILYNVYLGVLIYIM